MAKGGGGWAGCNSQQVFPIFLGDEKRFYETKFLAVGLSLGHLSMKKLFRSDLPLIEQKVDLFF